MSSGNAVASTAVSRIGQRRQVVIPKRVFDALKLRAGDFVEVSAEGDACRCAQAACRHRRRTSLGQRGGQGAPGEAEIKAGHSQPWRTVKNELGH